MRKGMQFGREWVVSDASGEIDASDAAWMVVDLMRHWNPGSRIEKLRIARAGSDLCFNLACESEYDHYHVFLRWIS